MLGGRSAGWFSITVPTVGVAFWVFCRPSDAPDRPAWLDRRLTSGPQLRRAHRPVRGPLDKEETRGMVVLGTDAHKRSHTVVATDETGRQVGEVTVAATSEGHLRLVKWSAQFTVRRWAIEDCRALSRHLEADLLKMGERVVRVPPKLMAGARRSARTRGKSDPIDALAVLELRCGNPTCRQRNSMAHHVRCVCWSITGSPWSRTVPRPRTGCGGVSTNSNPVTTRHRGR